MRVVRCGRIYVGNFGYDLFSEDPRPTHLAMVGRDGSIALQSDEVLFPNGMVMSSGGSLVVAETFANCLTTFSVNHDGSLRRETSLPLGECIPDGICIDAEVHVWISSVYDKQVVRISPDGERERHRVDQM